MGTCAVSIDSPRVPPSLNATIARLAVPAVAAVATEPLYDLSDASILGHLGAEQFGGAAVAMRLLSFGSAVFVFLTFAGTSTVARLNASGKRDKALRTGMSSMWIAAALGVTMSATIAILEHRLVAAMTSDPAVAAHARTYLLISAAGFPALNVVLAGIGIERGLHHTHVVLWVSLVSVVVNLGLEVLAVYALGMGVAGSAASTVAVKWGAAWWYWNRHRTRCLEGGVSTRPSLAASRDLLSVGPALVARTALLLGVVASCARYAAGLSVEALAAHSAAWTLWMLWAVVYEGTEVATTVLVAEHRAQPSPPPAGRLLAVLTIWSLGLGCLGALVMVIGRNWLATLFTSDPSVQALASGVIVFAGLQQPLCAVTFMVDALFVATRRTNAMAFAMITACAVFGVIIVRSVDDATALGGLRHLWIAFTAFMVTRCAAGVVGISPAFRSTPRRRLTHSWPK